MYKRIPRVMLILVLCFSFLATNYLVVLAQQQKQLDDNPVVKISHGPLPEGWFERPIDAIGDGPATLAFYEHQQKSGNYYELLVQAGDHISMDGLSAVPLLNGSLITAEPDDIKYEPDIFEDMPQQKSLVRPSLNSIPILTISTAAIILVGALLLWRGNKRSKVATVQAKQIIRKPADQKNTCPACGRAVRVGARFCRFCGTAIPTPQAKNICPSCGQTIRAGAAFCKNCGKKLH